MLRVIGGSKWLEPGQTIWEHFDPFHYDRSILFNAEYVEHTCGSFVQILESSLVMVIVITTGGNTPKSDISTFGLI